MEDEALKNSELSFAAMIGLALLSIITIFISRKVEATFSIVLGCLSLFFSSAIMVFASALKIKSDKYLKKLFLINSGAVLFSVAGPLLSNGVLAFFFLIFDINSSFDLEVAMFLILLSTVTFLITSVWLSVLLIKKGILNKKYF